MRLIPVLAARALGMPKDSRSADVAPLTSPKMSLDPKAPRRRASVEEEDWKQAAQRRAGGDPSNMMVGLDVADPPTKGRFYVPGKQYRAMKLFAACGVWVTLYTLVCVYLAANLPQWTSGLRKALYANVS